MAGSLGLTVYADAALSGMTTDQLRDSLDYFEPDAVAVPQPHHELEIRNAATGELPVVVIARSPHSLTPICTVGAVDLVQVPDPSALERLPELEGDRISTDGESYLLSDLLTLDVNLIQLDTTLDGRDAYETAFPDSLAGSYTHLTTEANPNYRKQWGSLDVQGVRPGANERQGQRQASIAHLDLRADGVVPTETVPAERFGLQALDQVGRTRAETLHEAGFRSRDAVADASLADLQELAGFGRETARTIHESATVITEGTVRRYGDEGFPSREPIFIDIETDGLNPTVVWLIGVLDRQTDTYRSFLAREPDEPALAVEAFMSWLTTNVGNRQVVAYNGRSFDFPVLEAQIADHCPESLDAWQKTWTFDPYHWATTEGQALLPGRTNQLADVAAALGWEGAETGLSGAVVARKFQQWLANPCEATELDWERHERYCEDDVRALAHVYDELAGATRTRARTGSTSSTDGTTQGQLGDFS